MPGSWLSSKRLGHGVQLGKFQDCAGVELGGVRTSHIVVNNGQCYSTLSLLQMILNSTRPIKAEDDEVSWCLEHGKLEQKMADLLGRVVFLSHSVDEQFLDCPEREVLPCWRLQTMEVKISLTLSAPRATLMARAYIAQGA